MGGYDSSLTEDTIAEAWDASVAAGATLFDTAEVYGKGESERIIGRLLASLRASCDRLGVESVDLYQIHGPVSLRGHAALAEALAGTLDAGLTKAVGVSNYSAMETRSIDSELRKREARLATNPIEFSLLRRERETNGLIAICQELGVVPLAYSPIGQGRLTGKYSAKNRVQAEENAGALGWRLTADEVAALDTVALSERRSLQNRFWQHG